MPIIEIGFYKQTPPPKKKKEKKRRFTRRDTYNTKTYPLKGDNYSYIFIIQSGFHKEMLIEEMAFYTQTYLL